MNRDRRIPTPTPPPDPVEAHRRRVVANLDPACARRVFDEEPLVDNVTGRIPPPRTHP
jgi:hypothetical protein